MDTLFYEGFFARDTLLHTDTLLFADGPRSAVDGVGHVGMLMPETLQRNDIVTASVLLCFAVLVLILRTERINKPNATSNELTRRSHILDVIVMLLIALLAALLFFCYAQTTTNLTTMQVSQIQLLGIFFAISALVIFSKTALYAFVNNIFFSRSKRLTWNESLGRITLLESLLLFPLTLLAVYFNLSTINVVFALVVMLLFVKILLLFKTYSTFFVKIYGILHLIVYFCALEAVPLLVLWLVLTKTTDYLAQL